ncbi:MAG: metallophosphoesterase [Clostridia bacterium]|nr:metallophosphoesterase [Clostridia bacterium]
MITEYKIVCNGIKKKVIYHFSDSHLTEYDSLSTPEEIEKAKSATEAWERVREHFARHGGEPYGEYEKLSPAYHFRKLLEIAKDGDALVLAGDTFDYVSNANLRFADKCLADFDKPIAAVCGNHESRKAIPSDGKLAKMGNDFYVVRLDDINIICVDNSQRIVTPEQNNALDYELSSGKKALIVIHVPIVCEQNESKIKPSGVYFQFNYEGCPEENLEFIKIIEKHAQNVIAVLAGHLHFSNYALLPGNVPQFVSSQAIVGNINRYVIGDADELL